MGTTAHGLPYPAPSDPVADGADNIRALAEAIDATLVTQLIKNNIGGRDQWASGAGFGIQAGSSVVSTGPDGGAVIGFFNAFAGIPVVVANAGDNLPAFFVTVAVPNAQGFNVLCAYGPGALVQGTVRINWIAIGPT